MIDETKKKILPTLTDAQTSSLMGKVTHFLFNAHSDVDGLLLDGAHQVHVPPHEGVEMVKLIKVGDSVSIQGVKSPKVDLLFARSITGPNKVVIHIKPHLEKKLIPPAHA